MKHIKFLSVTMFACMMLVLSGCFDDPGTDILLEDTYIEISEATTSTGLDVSKSYPRLNDGIAKKDSLRINLVGAHRSSPVSVTYSVDATSTAVAGVHYNLISGNTIQIPANSSFGYIYFEVISDNINAGEVWKLKVNLTSTDADVKISQNFKTFTRSLRITCPFVRDNFLGDFTAIEPGYSGSPYGVTFTTDADPNTIVVDNFWDFGGVVKYVFNPATNRFTLPTQNVVMGGSTYVVAQGAGTAAFDACTLSFTMPYTVTLNGVLQDVNTHTFTKD